LWGTAIEGMGGTELLPLRTAAQQQAKRIQRRDVVVSPDGEYVVLVDVPDFFAQAWNDNIIGNIGFFPADLYLTARNGSIRRQIAFHPEDAAYDQSATLRYRMINGDKHLAFSPDSTQIVYSEYDGRCMPDQSCTRLLIYDIEADTTTELYSWEDQIGTGPLTWTADGIYFQEYLFDPDGTLLQRLYLNEGVLVWRDFVHVDGQVYLTVSIRGFPNPDRDFVYLLDPATGDYYYVSAEITVVSAANPETSLKLVGYSTDTRPNSVYNADGELVATPPEGPPYGVAYVLSPDGQFYAYNLTSGGGPVTGNVFGVEAPPQTMFGTDFTIAGWGAGQYTLFSKDGDFELTPTQDPYSAAVCGPLPDVGLVAGGQGRVLPGTPNNIRAEPTTLAEVIGSIPGETIFDVVAGQQNVCVDGIRWAQVTYEDITGWTAQSVGADAFLEPIE